MMLPLDNCRRENLTKSLPTEQVMWIHILNHSRQAFSSINAIVHTETLFNGALGVQTRVYRNKEQRNGTDFRNKTSLDEKNGY